MQPRKSVIEYGLNAETAAIASARCGLAHAVKLIKSSLNGPNLKKFRASCFEHLLDVPHLEFRGVLCHLMLLHICDEDRGSVWFKIRNQVVEFGPREYYLCTGLKFGPPKMLPRNSDIHSRVFGGRKTLYVKDIEEALREASFKDKGSDDTLKLALLYFLYAVVFGQDMGRKFSFKLMDLHVVDDVAAFNSYPWGLVSFNLLIQNLFSSFDSLCQQANSEQRIRYDVYGFSHAFLCWVYESFPSIASLCTETVAVHESLFPRLLRRQSLSRKSWKEFRDFFLQGEDNLRFVSCQF